MTRERVHKMSSRSPFEVDDNFLRQVYRLTVVLGVIGTVILWTVYGTSEGLSFAIGSFLSLSAILSLEYVVRRLVKPGGPSRAKRLIGFILLGKYTVIFGGFYLLMKTDWLNVYSLAAGIGVVQLVIILKAVKLMTGILFSDKTTKDT